ncbi:proton-translocating NADH-quinone oxidoreductase subunit NdhD3 [Synechococcus elongatus]|uniref:Proton-translocating NADH-quinone oxidoreductase, chain M n=1 Tax=Synechococcus elongatus (strain ATCC 33912 / PCC 7942 / FACHB-805) TaxID=1140 RepID=Q31LE7_SYNE7|nr:proton-translocating NADH-quinone oxidoreductase subunit NdhD3 [Synechococcus elongatus]ABB58122.1 proton-translocating NADH-quinone oxidoreductase, chain M [Synechococcus elongatus PCC 7942 = FACHB-805]AJD57402.1 NAD(P)H-quinone oxidoreductase subunit D4 [Synechococcus elongatus UTEX 2973]MBD2586841.1 proton-translocating NADH-quinone oxidoreductase subunit NdhD3 [Synechococcus elongatus FACHB-242]MBD2687912.1 proton-translocating NADH-quinone oxidoreductase subunit NdhD3 [Synechococcus elo
MMLVLLITAILGASLLSLGSQDSAQIRRWAIAAASAILVLSGSLLMGFDPAVAEPQQAIDWEWLPSLGIHFSLGLDGLSLPLLLLSSLLTLLAIASSPTDQTRPRLYYSLIFLAAAGMAIALLSRDLLLFVLGYELELIPMYLLISIWGGEQRGPAATRFLIFTAISGILLLLGAIATAVLSSQPFSFAFDQLQTIELPLALQLPLLLLFVAAFAIKLPLVPFHSWQPAAYGQASPAIAMLLGGAIAKLGGYGLFRFGCSFFPEAWSLIAPSLAVLAAVTALYGSLNALRQTDLQRLVAFSSIGHMGTLLLALAAGTPLALQGAIAQMVAHGLILALLFQLVGTIERVTGRRDRDQLSGLLNPIRGLPLTAGLLLLAAMASAGIPGLVGFVAEFLIFQGSFAIFPWATVGCIAASGLTAVYFVSLINRACFGKLDNQEARWRPVTVSERWPAVVLALTVMALGLAPQGLVRWSESSSLAIAAHLPQPLQSTIAEGRSRSTPVFPTPSLSAVLQ